MLTFCAGDRPLAVGERRQARRNTPRARAGSAAASSSMAKSTQAQHLVIESNGLFGYPKNWEVRFTVTTCVAFWLVVCIQQEIGYCGLAGDEHALDEQDKPGALSYSCFGGESAFEGVSFAK